MKIILDNLKKYFGDKCAVNIEHYEINHGTMLGLVGNNGAGKTTLFRLILDLFQLESRQGKDSDLTRCEYERKGDQKKADADYVHIHSGYDHHNTKPASVA